MINSPSRWWCQSVALAALSLWCGGMDAAEPKAALPNDPAQAWAMITASEKAVQAPLPKPERLMTPAEIQASHDRARAQCSDLAAQAKEFLRRFPDDPRAGEARKVVIRSLSTISAGDHAREEELGAFIASVAANPAVPEDERVEMRLMQIRARAIRLIPAKGRAAADLEFALGFQELIREFPKSEKAFRNALGFARSRTGQDATNLARAISISDSTPGEIKQYARDYLAGKRPFEVGKPLDLKFTATDGSTVDLAALKGKVVLVDFWATWCAPCIEDLPRLKAAYAKFHDRGLEVLGISFDMDKAVMERFVRLKELPWPQYCDAKGWENHFGLRFDINNVPMLWLVDRQGVLRETFAREDFTEAAEKLLAEKP